MLSRFSCPDRHLIVKTVLAVRSLQVAVIQGYLSQINPVSFPPAFYVLCSHATCKDRKSVV